MIDIDSFERSAALWRRVVEKTVSQQLLATWLANREFTTGCSGEDASGLDAENTWEDHALRDAESGVQFRTV